MEKLSCLEAGPLEFEQNEFKKFFDESYTDQLIIQTLQKSMTSPSWATYSGLVHKEVSDKTRDMMYKEENVECLFGGTRSTAAKKISEYKQLPINTHYTMNADLF